MTAVWGAHAAGLDLVRVHRRGDDRRHRAGRCRAVRAGARHDRRAARSTRAPVLASAVAAARHARRRSSRSGIGRRRRRWTRPSGRLTYAADAAAVDDGHRLRPGVADQGAGHRPRWRCATPPPARCRSTTPVGRPAARSSRRRPRRVTVADLLRARRRPAGASAVLPRGRRPRRLLARHRRRAARRTRRGPRHEYTDLGFMLLGLLLEDAGGRRSTAQFDRLRRRRAGRRRASRFGPRASWRARVAPTERRPVARARAASATCTTTTPRRSAASPDTPASSAPPAAVGAFARWYLALWLGPRTASAGVPRAMAARSPTRGDGARQLARARLGHDAADLVVRHAAVAARLRPHRLHRHVALDRSRRAISTWCCLTNRVHPTRRRRRHPGAARRRARRVVDAW